MVKNMAIELIPTHVKGHQDDNAEVQSLGRLEQMNVIMDYLPKKVLNEYANTNEDFTIFYRHPKSFYTVYWKDRPILEGLYECIADEKAENYWIHKGRYTKENSQLIA